LLSGEKKHLFCTKNTPLTGVLHCQIQNIGNGIDCVATLQ